MKKYLTFAVFLVLVVALISPFSVSARTKAGVKSGSFFYFFDKALEKTSLFFTFNPEKKAKKALEYAEERLAEAEELKKEKEEKEAFEIKKEETKETETSEKEIKKTDAKSKEEKTETIIKNDESIKEIEKLKKEIETLKQKQSQVKIIEKVEKIIEKPIIIEKTQNSSSQTSNQIKQNENIITLPNDTRAKDVPSDTFVSEVSIDKEDVKNNGIDFATIQIITKLTNGKILPDKSFKIKTFINRDGIVLESFEDVKISDNQGLIIFKTKPTKYYDKCGWMKMFVNIIDTESNKIIYSKDIKIINVQSQSQQQGWGVPPTACS